VAGIWRIPSSASSPRPASATPMSRSTPLLCRKGRAASGLGQFTAMLLNIATRLACREPALYFSNH
jgi:hypothetical protein